VEGLSFLIKGVTKVVITVDGKHRDTRVQSVTHPHLKRSYLHQFTQAPCNVPGLSNVLPTVHLQTVVMNFLPRDSLDSALAHCGIHQLLHRHHCQRRRRRRRRHILSTWLRDVVARVVDPTELAGSALVRGRAGGTFARGTSDGSVGGGAGRDYTHVTKGVYIYIDIY